jgi:hypothetical protein
VSQPSAIGETVAVKVAAGTDVRAGVRRVRGALRRGGADRSGLASLTELCALNSAADACVAVALAGTVFFDVPVGQARGRVALYLLTTLAPFALLAPLIGPLLDRFHGRRVALGATMVSRAGLCWVMAGHTKGIELFPLALGILVISRGFGIARAAVTPRVLPEGMTLVRANARVSLVGALGGGLTAPLMVGVGFAVGIDWVLRLAALGFLVGVLSCTQLPAHVDSAAGERPARGMTLATFGGAMRPSLGGLPLALRALMPMRALVGFLTLFLAFQLRSGGGGKAGLAGLAGAAFLGQAIGIGLGNRHGGRRPELLITLAMVLATAGCLVGAVLDATPVSLAVAGVATLAASLGKLSLDAIVQRDIEEHVRTSAFARSETALQLSWAAGGGLGLLPVSTVVGLAVAAAGMVIALAVELTGLRSRQVRTAAAPGPPGRVHPEHFPGGG